VKIGDKVKVKTFDKIPSHWNLLMNEWMGKKVTISFADDNYTFVYRIKEDNGWWGWKELDFEIDDIKFLEDKLFEI